MDSTDASKPPQRWLTPVAKAWLIAIGGLASIDGAIWVLIPDFAQSTAYDLAIDIAPQIVWGMGMSLAGTLALSAVWYDGKSWAADAARGALALYMFITFVVGMSIAALTLNGFKSALTGATKWWGVAIVCLIGITGPALTGRERVSLIAWARGAYVGSD